MTEINNGINRPMVAQDVPVANATAEDNKNANVGIQVTERRFWVNSTRNPDVLRWFVSHIKATPQARTRMMTGKNMLLAPSAHASILSGSVSDLEITAMATAVIDAVNDDKNSTRFELA